MRLRSAVAVLVLICSCHDGRLVIELSLPEDKRLDPLRQCERPDDAQSCTESDPRLSQWTLTVEQAGKKQTSNSAIGAGELVIGQVPLDGPFDLRLAVHSATGQILGLGKVSQIDASSDDDVRVLLRFRKPIAYITGGANIDVLDTASAGIFALNPLEVPGVVDAAAARNGVLIGALTDKQLLRINTSDHCVDPARCLAPIGVAVAGQSNHCVEIDPNGETAAICHDSRLTLIDTLAAQAPRTRQVDLPGRPTKIAYHPDGKKLWVLLDGLSRGCDSKIPSQLVQLDIAAGRIVAGPVALGGPASDLVIDPHDGGVLISVPCETNNGRLLRIDGSGKPSQAMTKLPSFLAITRADNRVVLLGNTLSGEVSDALALVIDRSREAFPKEAELPALSRSIVIPRINVQLSNSSSPYGNLQWVSVPTETAIYQVEASPDGQRAVALFQARYRSEMQLSGCPYSTDIAAVGYMLLDLEASSTLLHKFTRLNFAKCSAPCARHNGQSMTSASVCSSAFETVLRGRNELSAQPYEASGATVLLADE